MFQRIKLEPAVITGAVQALLALLVAFGLKMTAEQVASILALSAAVLAIVTRQLVVPASKVSRVVVGGEPRNVVLPPAPPDPPSEAA